ncbi:hypothetical protein MMC25_003971 [Agyrium rufum]|nr:hypothetical protein [Agyrium rufum]
MPRVTRRSAANEAALAESNVPEDASKAGPTTQDTPEEPSSATKITARGKKAAPKVPANVGKKRKRATTLKVEDINELPHGLGRVVDDAEVQDEDLANAIDEPISSAADKEGKDPVLSKQDAEEVKDLVDKVIDTTVATNEEESPLKKRKTVAAAKKAVKGKDKFNDQTTEPEEKKKPKRTKKPLYGITLGETPYPNWPAPTREQAQEVNDILSKTHGAVRAPKEIPLPSLTVAGCGEVPSILEALLRTLLSAHTTNANAGRAVQGIVAKYGTLKEGHGKGGIDWNAVRQGTREELEDAIKHGGLAKMKSKNILKIINMVHEENQARRAEMAAKKADSSASDEDDIEHKAAASMLSDPNVLTLDYMHAMPASAAFYKFITFPGIGVKTASCTLLFCMQRPSFAVDTHVYRLCQYLGWVPMDATRDTTFAHCDVRIPDNLKYSLHQLLIRHGKTCGRCRAITGESSEGWDKGCDLEGLVKRHGAKKGGEELRKGGTPKKQFAGKKSKKVKDEDEDEKEKEMDADDETDGEIEIGGASDAEYTPVKKGKTPTKTAPEKRSRAVKEEVESEDEDEVPSKPPTKVAKGGSRVSEAKATKQEPIDDDSTAAESSVDEIASDAEKENVPIPVDSPATKKATKSAEPKTKPKAAPKTVKTAVVPNPKAGKGALSTKSKATPTKTSPVAKAKTDASKVTKSNAKVDVQEAAAPKARATRASARKI